MNTITAVAYLKKDDEDTIMIPITDNIEEDDYFTYKVWDELVSSNFKQSKFGKGKLKCVWIVARNGRTNVRTTFEDKMIYDDKVINERFLPILQFI